MKTTTLKNGITIYSHDDYIGSVLEKDLDFYEIGLLKKLPEFEGCVIDVGANIGNHSLYWASIGKHVYAFEPIKENFEILEKNTAGRSVVLYNFALGKEPGEMKMKLYPRNMGQCRRAEAGEIVKIKTLDSIGIAKVGLIKIDVEGQEKEVIEGALNTIAVNRPIIVMEKNEDMVEYMKTLGYDELIIDRIGPNYIFIPSPEKQYE